MRLLPYVLVSFVFLTYHFYLGTVVPFTWPDEVLFFNPAEEWYRFGILRTTVLSGLIPGMDEVTLWMPPLYMLLLGSGFHLFPVELWVGRMLSSSMGLIGALILVRWLSRFLPETRDKKMALLVGLGFILIDVLFIKVSHTSRMETICALFGILGMMMIHRKFWFFSGVALSLSFLSHPFGAFYSIPILYIGYINKDYFIRKNLLLPNIIILGLGGILPIIAWAIYVIPHWDLFLLQFGAQISRKQELFANFTVLDKIKTLVSGYFQSPIKLVLSIVTIGVAIPLLIKGVHRNLARILAVWMVAMFIGFYSSIEAWYAVHLVYPMAGFLILLLVTYKESFVRKLVILTVLVYQIFGFIWFQYGFSIRGNAHNTTQIFFQQVEELAEPHESLYLQLIPDPYFHLRAKYSNKKLYEFIPGELPIPEEAFKNTIEEIGLFLFYDDNLMNASLKSLLLDNPKYTRKEFLIPYSGFVPAKGPWRIVAYEKNP